jgi:peptidoglycan/xylan/chitin deacetylase (PgdA/CDA1 family)
MSVCLSFDLDAISVWIGSMGSKSPGNISRGEFGAVVGTGRILETLRRYEVESTWFIPGHTIETFPDVCRAVADAGHEVGHHNYLHENPRTLGEEAERAVLERGIECIERLCGRRPVGFRAPAADHSENTVRLLAEMGFSYDSSLMARDFEPYYARTEDRWSADGPFEFGQEVDLVELPVDWALDDWPYFGLNWNAHHVGLRTANEVFQTWAAEFDYFYERAGEGVFTMMLHPQLMGRGSRLLMLERLIEHMRRPGVRFRRLTDVAAEWRAANPLGASPVGADVGGFTN